MQYILNSFPSSTKTLPQLRSRSTLHLQLLKKLTEKRIRELVLFCFNNRNSGLCFKDCGRVYVHTVRYST